MGLKAPVMILTKVRESTPLREIEGGLVRK